MGCQKKICHSDLINGIYAVLKEEVEEMWDDIKKDDNYHAVLECVQVGAMAVKFIANFRHAIHL